MIGVLKKRFEDNAARHPDLVWEDVEALLRNNEKATAILQWMEDTGGEPDTIGYDDTTGRIIYCDCSRESPAWRRSLCYDDEALQKRTKNPPAGSVVHQAQEHGLTLMDETLYRRLQSSGIFDTKTSSWIATPDEIRKLGGALFCERRYGTVFTFHNGADSYYSVRGWRGWILL